MRLIDAEELMKFPLRRDNYDRENGNEHFINGIETVLEYAETMPTVDAVPVIRCKDCKYFIADTTTETFVCVTHSCTNDVMDMSFTVWEDNYCSWAERRDNETD